MSNPSAKKAPHLHVDNFHNDGENRMDIDPPNNEDELDEEVVQMELTSTINATDKIWRKELAQTQKKAKEREDDLKMQLEREKVSKIRFVQDIH